MQFEVNGQSYFLNFVPEEGRWFLFKPTRSGIAAVPVINDDEQPMLIPQITGPADTDIVN